MNVGQFFYKNEVRIDHVSKSILILKNREISQNDNTLSVKINSLVLPRLRIGFMRTTQGI
jgi:hypothetical protein